jgi:hypothetical protein
VKCIHCKLCGEPIKIGEMVTFIGEGEVVLDSTQVEVKIKELYDMIHRICYIDNDWNFLKKERRIK